MKQLLLRRSEVGKVSADDNDDFAHPAASRVLGARSESTQEPEKQVEFSPTGQMIVKHVKRDDTQSTTIPTPLKDSDSMNADGKTPSTTKPDDTLKPDGKVPDGKLADGKPMDTSTGKPLDTSVDDNSQSTTTSTSATGVSGSKDGKTKLDDSMMNDKTTVMPDPLTSASGTDAGGATKTTSSPFEQQVLKEQERTSVSGQPHSYQDQMHGHGHGYHGGMGKTGDTVVIVNSGGHQGNWPGMRKDIPHSHGMGKHPGQKPCGSFADKLVSVPWSYLKMLQSMAYGVPGKRVQPHPHSTTEIT